MEGRIIMKVEERRWCAVSKKKAVEQERMVAVGCMQWQKWKVVVRGVGGGGGICSHSRQLLVLDWACMKLFYPKPDNLIH